MYRSGRRRQCAWARCSSRCKSRSSHHRFVQYHRFFLFAFVQKFITEETLLAIIHADRLALLPGSMRANVSLAFCFYVFRFILGPFAFDILLRNNANALDVIITCSANFSTANHCLKNEKSMQVQKVEISGTLTVSTLRVEGESQSFLRHSIPVNNAI
jgi:hypothetical protein